MTLLLKFYGLEYLRPHATIEILHFGFFAMAPKAIIETPAFNGKRSVLS
jgi:hypothetical protein